jgi:flagellar hook-associated protein 1
MINQLSLGLSAIRAAQYGISVVGNNIANASTPGYHRQMVDLRNREPQTFTPFQFGTGVELTEIRRNHSRILEQSLTTNYSGQGDSLIRLTTSQQLESALAPSSGSLSDRVNGLFARLDELALHPDDASSRRAFVSTAVELTNTVRATSAELDRIQNQVDQEIQGTVDRVNALSRDIVTLNQSIIRAKAQGIQANDLLDQRDQLVNDLAQYVDVRMDYGSDLVLAADSQVVLGTNPPQALVVEKTEDGISIRQGDTGHVVSPVSGQLTGLLELRNQILPHYNGKLHDTAKGLIEVFDRQHVMGVGTRGPFTELLSGRTVRDSTTVLNQLDTAVPIIDGTVNIAVIDQATGSRTLHEIDVDASVDTLQSIAAKISTIPQLQAVVNTSTGGIAITSAGGYAFDFAGGASTTPNTSAVAGTMVPTISGIYSGTANTDFQFNFSGPGEIGVTDGLSLEVRDAAGNLIQTLQVGAGYEAGSPIQLDNGLSLSLASGTVVAGDDFQVSAVGTSDTSGFLTALGLNTFFVGSDPASLRVDPRIVQSPSNLGLSTTGAAGDVNNLTRIAARRGERILDNNTVNLEDFVKGTVANIGEDVNTHQRVLDGLSTLGESLQAQRASASGVDPNEEAIQMLKYQQAFEAAAQYLSVINQTTEELFRIIG